MNPKYFGGAAFLYLMLTVFSGLIELTYVGEAEASVLGNLVYVDVLTTGGAWEGIKNFFMGVFTAPMQFINALWAMFTFDYAMYTGDYLFVRLLLIAVVSVGIISSLILGWVRGVSSA